MERLAGRKEKNKKMRKEKERLTDKRLIGPLSPRATTCPHHNVWDEGWKRQVAGRVRGGGGGGVGPGGQGGGGGGGGRCGLRGSGQGSGFNWE